MPARQRQRGPHEQRKKQHMSAEWLVYEVQVKGQKEMMLETGSSNGGKSYVQGQQLRPCLVGGAAPLQRRCMPVGSGGGDRKH